MPFPIHPKSPALKSHAGPVHVVTYNSNGQYALTGGQDKKILLWNPNTGSLVKQYISHGYEVLDIAVAHDNATFASCGGDRSVFFWDVMTATVLRKLSGHTARVNSVALNADASVMVSGSYDSTVRLWDCKSGSAKPIQVLADAKDSVADVLVAGHEIITGSVDGTLRVYDVRKGQLTADLVGHPITSITVSTDATSLLVSTLDDTIRLMDRANGSLLQTFKGHKNSEYRVRSCFGENETYVVSGSETGRVYVWDFLTGRIVHELRGHAGKVVSDVAYHPREGQHQMLSCGTDGTVQVWTT
ncbi:WD40-repeat-containing domain protein [Dipodascopsis tothii]|uniref:WD40-repeat-containing domain protein n=1 Tax=Dipodascopsis tothii TaxID=44089 RepID=UPI0034CE14FA